jgi:hypothetical protein
MKEDHMVTDTILWAFVPVTALFFICGCILTRQRPVPPETAVEQRFEKAA